MKKLMIAAAVVCAAALSQASSFDWFAGKLCYSVDASELTKLVNGKVYNAATSDSSVNSMSAQAGTVTWQMIMSITDAAGTETLDPVAITGYSSKKPKVEGKLASDKVFIPGKGGDPCEFSYSVIFKGTLTDAGGNVWTLTSDPIACGSKKLGEQDELLITAPTTAIPSKWTATTENVPEPTSAMLLLLGVAGLALKRRRA